MQEDAYRRFLAGQNLSQGTQDTRSSALRRIERSENLDLDREFEADGLTGLIGRFAYSTQDQRDGRPNPSSIDIEPENLYKYLAFFRSAINSYRKFRSGGVLEPLEETSDAIEANDASELAGRTFSLERDLQAALRGNIARLEPGLRIVDDGREVKVEAGLIDILAQDTAGAWVVIELKAEVGRPAVIAQTLAYMSSIRAERGGNVRGIIVASDFDRRVELAAQAVPDVSLKRYRFHFEFEDGG